MEDPLDRLLAKRLGSDGQSLPDDDASRATLPILWSFLTRRDVDANMTKEPAAVSIRMGLGQWIVTLTDQSLEVSLSCSSSCLASCLQDLEAAARNPTAAWTPWKKSRGKFDKVNAKSSGHASPGS